MYYNIWFPKKNEYNFVFCVALKNKNCIDNFFGVQNSYKNIDKYNAYFTIIGAFMKPPYQLLLCLTELKNVILMFIKAW